MADEQKKNIFDRAFDAISNRDEKAAAEAAKKQAEAAKLEADRAKAELEKMKAETEKARLEAEKVRQEADKARQEADAAKKAAMDMEMKQRAQDEREELAEERARKSAAAQAAAEAAAKAAVVKHVWTSEDTYASLAQKFYGRFTEPYWRLIYEHNKEIIGHHPNAIRVGLEIEIPPLPDELKY